MNADMMASENVTSNVEAEIDDDEEDYSDDDDDVTGTEDDDITDGDDDFEFKDLEKEIYGRLGGPPPELKEAMKTLAVVDRNDSKKENKKENKKRRARTKKERGRGRGRGWERGRERERRGREEGQRTRWGTCTWAPVHRQSRP